MQKRNIVVLSIVLSFAILVGVFMGMILGIQQRTVEESKKEQNVEEESKREVVPLENQPKPRTNQELLEEKGWVHIDKLSESDMEFRSEIDEHHRRYITNEKDPYLKILKGRSGPSRTYALSIRTIRHQDGSILFDVHETNVDEIFIRFAPKGGSFYTIQYTNPNEVYILRETTEMRDIGWFERRKKEKVEIDGTLKDALKYCGVKL